MIEKPEKDSGAKKAGDRELWQNLRFVSTLGAGSCGIVLFCFLLGWAADWCFSTGKVAIVVMVFLGGVLSIFWAWGRVSAMMQELYKRRISDLKTKDALKALEPEDVSESD